jgi:hypothetical protein
MDVIIENLLNKVKYDSDRNELPIGKILNDGEFISFYNNLKMKCSILECLFPDNTNCSSKIIKAHSIQNNKYLRQISKDNNVIKINGRSANHIFTAHPDLINRNKASIFSGFCEYHDNEIFKRIEEEDYIVGDIEQEFLFAYRALCYSYLSFKQVYNQGLFFQNKFPHLRDHNEFVENISYRLLSLEVEKNMFDLLINSGKFNLISSFHFRIPFKINVALSSYIIMGTELKRDDIFVEDVDFFPKYISFSILPENDHGYFIVSCFRGNAKKYSAFLNLLKRYEQEDYNFFKQILSNIIIYFCNNWFVNPDFWDSLGEKKHNFICEEVKRVNTDLKLNKMKLLTSSNEIDLIQSN